MIDTLEREQFNQDAYSDGPARYYRSNYVVPPLDPNDVNDIILTNPGKYQIDGEPIVVPPYQVDRVTLSSTQSPYNSSSSAVGAAALADGVDPAISNPIDRLDTQIPAFVRANPNVIDGNGDVGAGLAFTGPYAAPPVPMPAYTLPRYQIVTSPHSSTMGDAPEHDDQVSVFVRPGEIDYNPKVIEGLSEADNKFLEGDIITRDPSLIGTSGPYSFLPMPNQYRNYDPLTGSSLPAQPTQPSVNENTNGVPRNIGMTGGGGDSGTQSGQVRNSVNKSVQGYESSLVAPSVNRNTGASASNPVTDITAKIPSIVRSIVDLFKPSSVMGTTGYDPNTNANQNRSGVVNQPKVSTTGADTLVAPNQKGVFQSTTSKQIMIALIIAIVAGIAATLILRKVGK